MSQHATLPAFFLGVALRDLFPGDRYLGCGVDGKGFFATIERKEPFDEAFLPMLENRMRELLEKEGDIRHTEMLASNAAELFEHHGETLLAKKAKALPGTVYVATLGDRLDIVGEILATFEELRLYEWTQEGRRITITGWAFPSPQERQQFDKALRLWKRKGEVPQTHFFFDGEEWIWHPAGMKALRALQQQHSDLLARFGIREMQISSEKAEAYCKEHHLPGLYFWEEGRADPRDFYPGPFLRDRIYLADPNHWKDLLEAFNQEIPIPADPLGRPWPTSSLEGHWATLFSNLQRALYFGLASERKL